MKVQRVKGVSGSSGFERDEVDRKGLGDLSVPKGVMGFKGSWEKRLG